MFQFLEKTGDSSLCSDLTLMTRRFYKVLLSSLRETTSYFLLLLLISKPTKCIIVLRTNILSWLIEIRFLRELVSNCGTAIQSCTS